MRRILRRSTSVAVLPQGSRPNDSRDLTPSPVSGSTSPRRRRSSRSPKSPRGQRVYRWRRRVRHSADSSPASSNSPQGTPVSSRRQSPLSSSTPSPTASDRTDTPSPILLRVRHALAQHNARTSPDHSGTAKTNLLSRFRLPSRRLPKIDEEALRTRALRAMYLKPNPMFDEDPKYPTEYWRGKADSGVEDSEIAIEHAGKTPTSKIQPLVRAHLFATQAHRQQTAAPNTNALVLAIGFADELVALMRIVSTHQQRALNDIQQLLDFSDLAVSELKPLKLLFQSDNAMVSIINQRIERVEANHHTLSAVLQVEHGVEIDSLENGKAEAEPELAEAYQELTKLAAHYQPESQQEPVTRGRSQTIG